MTTHAQARGYAENAIVRHYNRGAAIGETKALAGISRLETGYGDGWKGAGVGSFNQGAIQCGSGWQGDRFSYVDTHPNADGSSTPYRIDFRKYPTVGAGWDDLVHVAYVNRGREVVRQAAVFENYHAVSERLHSTGYYEGYGKTVAERINNHYRALSKAIAAADNAIAPVVPIYELPQTVRFGDHNEAVKLMQLELQIAADGIFGKVTRATLIAYQRAHQLTADGVCGPATWECLFADEYQPRAA